MTLKGLRLIIATLVLGLLGLTASLIAFEWGRTFNSEFDKLTNLLLDKDHRIGELIKGGGRISDVTLFFILGNPILDSRTTEDYLIGSVSSSMFTGCYLASPSIFEGNTVGQPIRCTEAYTRTIGDPQANPIYLGRLDAGAIAPRNLDRVFGHDVIDDYREPPVKVLSVYKRININGQDYAMASEVDRSEVVAPLRVRVGLIGIVGFLITFVVFLVSLQGYKSQVRELAYQANEKLLQDQLNAILEARLNNA